MLNVNGRTMVEHHTHYKEIHGFDRTVWMEKGVHKALHNRLRKDGKCDIPVDVLDKISRVAYNRTEKGKISLKNAHKRYRAKYIKALDFTDGMMLNVRHHEYISYNYKNGIVKITCYFYANHGKKLLYIDLN